MPHESKPDRRMLLLGLALTGAASAETRSKKKGDEEKDVAADELLMREHGVMRRTMLVYAAVAEKLRTGANVDADVLNRTARLFRNFAEDYHEKRLEEAYIFPAARNAGGFSSLCWGDLRGPALWSRIVGQ